MTSSVISSLDTLDLSLTIWERIECAAEAFVILGCAGEYIAEFTHVGTDEWRHRFGKLSLLILTAALGVELGALVRTNSLSGKEIALLNGIAADARIRAANAEGTAKGFDSRIAEAQRGTADAESKVEGAKKDAEQAREGAESEKLERIKLEARVAPRSLDLDQQRSIRDVMHRLSGHPPVPVSSYGLDGEGAAIGAQIISILGSAGIQAPDERAMLIVTGGFENGIHIRGPKSEDDFMSTLGNALRSIGKLQVCVNCATFRPGVMQSGAVTKTGPGILAGGGGMVVPDVPTTGPVRIMVGVKPVPVLLDSTPRK